MAAQCALGEVVVEAQRREVICLNALETLNRQKTAVICQIGKIAEVRDDCGSATWIHVAGWLLGIPMVLGSGH